MHSFGNSMLYFSQNVINICKKKNKKKLKGKMNGDQWALVTCVVTMVTIISRWQEL